MALLIVYVYLYDKTGTSRLERQGQDTTTTISGVIGHWNHYHQNDQISAISDSIGGTALDPDLQLGTLTGGEEGEVTLYDVTPEPEPETITGFFLDGQEYVLGGSGGGEWGTITGTLSDQTDLQTALNAKANSTDVLTKTNTTSYTPSADYNPATKKYVDDNAGTEYNAGEGISIETISGRKGPSPDGFHVPSITEWQGVKTIMDGLSLTTGNEWKTNLHMPFSGYRSHSNALIYSQDPIGFYWSSSTFSESSNYVRILNISSSNVLTNIDGIRANGSSIRCFKDSYITPDSTWTVVQGTLGSAGIFWNQSQGLISITDGTTGYTIMDKNLGATTVYNNGDTLTQSNMGNMYQWGNNYGFPSTGTISKTSSTQIDTSAYGPKNPYSSDTFITGNEDWSSVQNDGLWGTQENMISNTGVLSVNGQTGDVTIQTGGNYTAGNGIDITNEEIGLDGTYERESEGEDYSAMKGPAPDGFHVPLSTEWEGLKTIMDGLDLITGDNWRINLHMPFAGNRSYSTADLKAQGSYGYYWSSSPRSAGSDYASSCSLLSSRASAKGYFYRANGLSVRCFKDSYVTPTSSWTVIYGTLGSAGIFRDQTNGLISITSDGSTGYTIMDKNLGATTVYSDGATLSEANCGKYYQWGNNYGFLRTGNVTTSTSQVNAQNYGPGNYYSSSTFICGSYDWSSVYNDNLRGGETGVQPIIISGNLILGDKLYKIVTSTTAPASGTASNIITIVTD